MIFVAVGTQKFPFDRLLSHIDTLLASGELTEPVFAQIGNSTYQPSHCEFVQFLDKESFDEKVAACDLLLTHSGVGTIISGLKHKKPVIVVPRLAQYGEHVDDHQLEIASAFAEKNLVLLCGEKEDLISLINQAKQHSFSPYHSQRDNVIATITDYLDTV